MYALVAKSPYGASFRIIDATDEDTLIEHSP